MLLFSHQVVSDSSTPWTAACQASLSFTISQRLLKLLSMESVMPSNHLILCCPLLLLPSIFPGIRVFSSEYSGLTCFRMGWFDLCYPRDSQVSSPAPQFKSIDSLTISLFYSPTLTFVHDYWKNHSFD